MVILCMMEFHWNGLEWSNVELAGCIVFVENGQAEEEKAKNTRPLSAVGLSVATTAEDWCLSEASEMQEDQGSVGAIDIATDDHVSFHPKEAIYVMNYCLSVKSRQTVPIRGNVLIKLGAIYNNKIEC